MVAEREKHLKRNLDKIVEDLKRKYNPEKIILFGSFASGRVKEYSDLDLLIVKNTNKRFWDRIKEVVKLCDYDVGVDFLVYTPEEYEGELRNNIFFREEIVKKGKVIYGK
ncbi:MAG: nucleotidyltransferase domain-containing protein [Actinobacteria bacterium]|nr:nucleotidyltransferase domain-containing protein [Actinomycetota bacterium]